MADHINISDPDDYPNRLVWEHRLDMALMKVRLEHAEKMRDHFRDNLSAVFTRIRRGDDVWITGNDGERIVVAAITETKDTAA